VFIGAAPGNTTTVTIIDSPNAYANSSWPRGGRGSDNLASLATRVERHPPWTMSSPYCEGRPVLDANGTLLVVCDNPELFALRLDGSILWTSSAMTAISGTSPALLFDGTYITSTYFPSTHAIDTANGGALKWTYGTGSTDVVIGGDGTVFVGGLNGLHAVHPNGTFAWSNLDTGLVKCSPTISANGTVFCTGISFCTLFTSLQSSLCQPVGTSLGAAVRWVHFGSLCVVMNRMKYLRSRRGVLRTTNSVSRAPHGL
jgi:hypothetical protein